MSTLPTSDPSTIGQLYNDGGTLSVSTVYRHYNDGRLSWDLSAGKTHIAGITGGYIEWSEDDTEFLLSNDLSNIIYMQGDSVPSKTFYYTNRPNGIGVIEFSSDIGQVTLTFAKPSTFGVVRFSFDANSNSVTINGESVDVEYEVGSGSVGFKIPDPVEEFSFGGNSVGFYCGLVVNNGTANVLDYSGAQTTDALVDSVNAANGVAVVSGETGGGNAPLIPVTKVGYNASPYKTLNRYVEQPEANPFGTPPFDLSTEPSDSDRAYLKRISDGSPIILDDETDDLNSYPNWDFDIEDITRNSNCWFHKKAMTCFSVLSDFHGFSAHGTLLSPRHIIMAEHVRDDFPTTWDEKYFHFMDLNGTYQSEKIIDYEVVGVDSAICYLENEITLDVDFATFMTDADAVAYDSTLGYGCGPSKEGIFAIERTNLMCSLGVPGLMTEQPEWKWSRYNNPQLHLWRGGDSSSPAFFLYGDKLYLMIVALTATGFPFQSQLYDGEPYSSCIITQEDRGLNLPAMKAAIKVAMDTLDTRNGAGVNYNLVEEAL